MGNPGERVGRKWLGADVSRRAVGCVSLSEVGRDETVVVVGHRCVEVQGRQRGAVGFHHLAADVKLAQVVVHLDACPERVPVPDGAGLNEERGQQVYDGEDARAPEALRNVVIQKAERCQKLGARLGVVGGPDQELLQHLCLLCDGAVVVRRDALPSAEHAWREEPQQEHTGQDREVCLHGSGVASAREPPKKGTGVANPRGEAENPPDVPAHLGPVVADPLDRHGDVAVRRDCVFDAVDQARVVRFELLSVQSVHQLAGSDCRFAAAIGIPLDRDRRQNARSQGIQFNIDGADDTRAGRRIRRQLLLLLNPGRVLRGGQTIDPALVWQSTPLCLPGGGRPTRGLVTGPHWGAHIVRRAVEHPHLSLWAWLPCGVSGGDTVRHTRRRLSRNRGACEGANVDRLAERERPGLVVHVRRGAGEHRIRRADNGRGCLHRSSVGNLDNRLCIHVDQAGRPHRHRRFAVAVAAAASAQPERQVDRRLRLDAVVAQGAAVLQLLAGEDEALLVGWDPLLVLELGLDGLDRVRGLDRERDGPAGDGLDEDLQAGEDEALLVGWDPLLVLDLGLDGLDRVRGLVRERDGPAGDGLDEDLQAGEDEALLVGWDPLLVLDLGLDGLDRVRGLVRERDGPAGDGLDEDLPAGTRRCRR